MSITFFPCTESPAMLYLLNIRGRWPLPDQRATMNQPVQRRDFLRQSAALAGAAVGYQLLADEKEKDLLPIIDTHQHLWDLKKFRLPWLKKDSVLDRNFVMDD